MGSRSKASPKGVPPTPAPKATPADAGAGAATEAARKVQTRDQKNTVAGLQARKAMGLPLTEAQEQTLRSAAQSSDTHQ